MVYVEACGESCRWVAVGAGVLEGGAGRAPPISLHPGSHLEVWLQSNRQVVFWGVGHNWLGKETLDLL